MKKLIKKAIEVQYRGDGSKEFKPFVIFEQTVPNTIKEEAEKLREIKYFINLYFSSIHTPPVYTLSIIGNMTFKTEEEAKKELDKLVNTELRKQIVRTEIKEYD